MKSVITFTIVLGLFSCQNSSESKTKQSEPTKDLTNKLEQKDQPFIIENAKEVDFENAYRKYSENIVYDTLNHEKINCCIKLNTDKNELVSLCDTLNDYSNPNFRIYKYIGNYPSLKFYLVRALYYEFVQCYLIDKTNGKTFNLLGIPKLSPNQMYFANINENAGMGDEPFSYEIWKLDNQDRTIKKIGDYVMNLVYPKDFVWEDESSIILKADSLTTSENQEKKSIFLRLRIK